MYFFKSSTQLDPTHKTAGWVGLKNFNPFYMRVINPTQPDPCPPLNYQATFCYKG